MLADFGGRLRAGNADAPHVFAHGAAKVLVKLTTEQDGVRHGGNIADAPRPAVRGAAWQRVAPCLVPVITVFANGSIRLFANGLRMQ
jgi:hypothetical protein